MKKYGIALFVLSLATFGFAGSGVEDTTARLQAAGVVLQEIMATPEKGIPEECSMALSVLPWCQTWRRVHSSLAESMDAVWLPAGLPMAGVRQHSFPSVVAILASRLALSQSISSCCS